LLSIKPEFAKAIFSGEKRFEFRRLAFKQAVDIIVVYVTSPVCEVWGEFDVNGIITDRPMQLWSRTQAAAGINRTAFFDYFAGKAEGHAIKIGSARRYATPLQIERDFGVQPPQSFVYLDKEA
jgi:predicted transcriptional regulator